MQTRLGSLYHRIIRRWFAVGVLMFFLLNLPGISFGEPESQTIKRAVVTTDGHSCPIQISDPYGGRLDEAGYDLKELPRQKTRAGGLSLYLVCFSADDTVHIRYSASATYDKHKGRWKRDVSMLPPEERRTTQTFPVHSINSAGMGMTRGATTDDPRTFAFCLRHPPVVLCGGMPVSGLLSFNQNTTDLMPYVKTIMNSIEFVDAEAAASAH